MPPRKKVNEESKLKVTNCKLLQNASFKELRIMSLISEMDTLRKAEARKSHPIYDAVLKASISTIQTLINLNDVSLGMKTKEGWTPLHVAVIYSIEDCVSPLLHYGTNPSIKDNEGKSVLHWAAYRNISFKSFHQLVSNARDQELDTKDRYGRTPLHYICLNDASCKAAYIQGQRNNHELILKLHLLLNKTTRIDAPDNEGNTPLLLLCANIHNCVEAEVQCDLLPEDLKSYKSKSVCGLVLEMMLNHGANFRAQNEYGLNALHLACHSHCVEMVRFLLSCDSSVTPILDASGNTPMSLIFTSISTCLSLKYGSVQHSDWFPLSDHRSRFEDTLRPVLKRWKTSVNFEKKVSGFTVLFYAFMDLNCHYNVLKGLLGYGRAEVNHKNYLGKTPLHYAVRPEMYLSTHLMQTLAENWRKKVQLLIQSGAVVNIQDLNGCSPLHDAAIFGDLELIELLLDNNADINTVNNWGATPLHFLCLNMKPFSKVDPMVDLLLQTGVDINRQDLYGSTAIHYAIYADNKEMTLKLLGKGASEKLKDGNGLNAKEYCQSLGHTYVNNYLPADEPDEQENIQDNIPNMSDCYMMPVRIRQVPEWLESNMVNFQLSDDKLRKLAQSSDANRLSNSPLENIVLQQLLHLMTATLKEVERIDPRFKVTLELSGSTREGTKVENPDEFDLLCFLDNFSSICEVEEYEGQFVYCRLKEGKDTHMYQSLFDDKNLLLGHRLTTSFYLNIRKALSNPSVWEAAPGFSMDKSLDDYPTEKEQSGIRCLSFRFCDSRYKYLAVSCDIVPAIRKRHWWPSFARQDGRLVSSEIKNNGCMVIAKPCKEIAFSGEIVRMLTAFKASIYLSECSVLLSLPPAILQAYKLAKILLKQKNLYPPLQEDPDPEGKENRIYHRSPIQTTNSQRGLSSFRPYPSTRGSGIFVLNRGPMIEIRSF